MNHGVAVDLTDARDRLEAETSSEREAT